MTLKYTEAGNYTEAGSTQYRAGSGVGRIMGWGAIIAGAAGLFLCRSVFFDVAGLAASFVSPPAAIEARDSPPMEPMPTRIDPRPRANLVTRETQPAATPVVAAPAVPTPAPVAVARAIPAAESPSARPPLLLSQSPPPVVIQPQLAAPANSFPAPQVMARPVNALPTVETPHARVVTGMSTGGAEAVAERQRNGHFGFTASINGNALPMMFDTGAGLVTLRVEDVARVGIDPARLNFSGKMSTANGITSVAQIVIDTMTIGGITVRDVRALVAPPGALGVNLIGQSFMTKLAGYNVDGDRLILRGQ